MLPILQEGEPVLREKAQVVPPSFFGTPELTKMLADMAATLDAEKDGVALAAPQVGIPYRIFIVRYDRMQDGREEPQAPEVGVFINPRFLKTSRKKEEMQEGCLSVRGIYGTTVRHAQATVEALDEKGVPFSRGGGGILAQAFQHETDHLDGMLFIDHALETHTPQADESHAAE
jgi:peptide deformylase